jgi:hypothetical protein
MAVAADDAGIFEEDVLVARTLYQKRICPEATRSWQYFRVRRSDQVIGVAAP